MNLILFEPNEVQEQHIHLPIADARAQHILNVLKLVPHKMFRAGILGSTVHQATLLCMDQHKLVIQLSEGLPCPKPHNVDLWLAMPRPKALRRMYSPLAQIGLRSLFLSGAEKVDPSYMNSHYASDASAKAHVIDGLMQAGNTHPYSIHFYPSFDLVMDRILPQKQYTHRWVCDVGSHPLISKQSLVSPASSVLLAIGPEGGWTNQERISFSQSGFTFVSLGDRIFRSELAAPLALFSVLNHSMG